MNDFELTVPDLQIEKDGIVEKKFWGDTINKPYKRRGTKKTFKKTQHPNPNSRNNQEARSEKPTQLKKV